jgi:hypothetical protein
MDNTLKQNRFKTFFNRYTSKLTSITSRPKISQADTMASFYSVGRIPKNQVIP